MKEYFTYRESSNKGWMIYPKHNYFGDPRINGSFALLPCRMLGISWPDWLRLCEANGAKLYGKNNLYVHAIWSEPNKDFLNMINKRTNEIAERVDLATLKY